MESSTVPIIHSSNVFYPGEEWRPVVGHEDSYEVSNIGRVRSLDRLIFEPPSAVRPKGRKIKRRGQMIRGLALHSGHRYVQLPSGPARIHRMVWEAFRGVIPEGLLVRHINDHPEDNRLDNLAIGDHSDNRNDAVRNGIHPMKIKTHCPQGHPYSPENTYHQKDGGRLCRTCCLESARESAARNPEKTRENKRRYKAKMKARRSGIMGV